MNKELTEEEMRQALFGNPQISPRVSLPSLTEVEADIIAAPISRAVKKKPAKTFTPRLLVTLRVSNEFEGKTYEILHEADTLSTLLAEQEATKAARRKYRYVEVVSVKSM
ncbi:hypothetical protein JN403_03585 [Pseudomonas sp. 15A4]|uniref:hypothetical protein n=1 Tax=Pseudomonas sp. 15A4 TaxID=2804761 RepID=UPI0019681D2C|nr:hypothetical protein [Pseudomonas sp. 15A4]QSB20123.1 hypothetical protein JN403_03585 [Pseudomonas sp. 15A4]